MGKIGKAGKKQIRANGKTRNGKNTKKGKSAGYIFIISCRKSPTELLKKAVAVVQHHDAITGTCKDYVATDYQDQLRYHKYQFRVHLRTITNFNFQAGSKGSLGGLKGHIWRPLS